MANIALQYTDLYIFPRKIGYCMPMIKEEKMKATGIAKTTVIFDMDGVLIDSEPLWHEAANEAFARFGIRLSPEAYATSIGLRTKEFVASWFRTFGIRMEESGRTEEEINRMVIRKIEEKGEAMPGVGMVLQKLKSAGLTIGLATSSPRSLIDVVVDKLAIRGYFSVFTSAEGLPHGKPHPQVYLDCASALGVAPVDCCCFEDSFNGMIAAKAARMNCIAIPPPALRQEGRFMAADLVLGSLEDFELDMLRF
jgi:mannitol-1-/sugar-/sorbitol-6-/2-deoxyglucose-6-phosphatase